MQRHILRGVSLSAKPVAASIPEALAGRLEGVFDDVPRQFEARLHILPRTFTGTLEFGKPAQKFVALLAQGRNLLVVLHAGLGLGKRSLHHQLVYLRIPLVQLILQLADVLVPAAHGVLRGAEG
ncbi:hypothetical protein DVU_3345 [Nitratidesulfovibrio vulgaris str. Hildenborough]|uniref:Uncharacterized protein n=2 Tax=Nitratidesulfovibrio vulgaris TaxID=881 RepID=Q725S9_NITV2|nr:hypothetical protein DVU_3345 [Nitratidesulfovibrio vulgaris str. Hildenborough]ABM27073.1 conserved hypothetical protein [Nitratidesulfovibrio vulgaris DP4]